MKTLSSVLGVMALSAAALAWAGPGRAAPQPPGQCFRMSDTGGWRVTPDARTMYMRVRNRDVYQVDLRSPCPALNRIGVHLVHVLRGGDTICSPIEFDLRVADNGSRMPAISCLVGSYRMLSPAEVAALPPKLRP